MTAAFSALFLLEVLVAGAGPGLFAARQLDLLVHERDGIDDLGPADRLVLLGLGRPANQPVLPDSTRSRHADDPCPLHIRTLYSLPTARGAERGAAGERWNSFQHSA